ncbi:exocyst complex component 2-like isoform X2 [Ostrea edulis]|uniref:exocyst complex component 2-like isoform X2 n=1 Tax=Ostrea edulis TaxID=37623 RepID=UPI0024AF2FF2|nr:exocyst complex component 2-like isoform X2 [Ostrea edulis]
MPKGGFPLVTGVSPKEGPPGTRITIRGENLGTDPKDLVGLNICGVNCVLTAEWKSSSKIIARSGPGKGKGDVTVITKSGGVGSCTVGFKGYFVQIGPLQESAIWIDESQTVNVRRLHTQLPLFSKDDDDPLGISDEGIHAKYKEEELLDIFPEASGNLSLENFSAAWYLLENHHSTSFDDLKAGLSYMKRRASHRSEGPIAFVKSNLSSTLDCLESLDAMYQQFCIDDLRGDSVNSYAVLLMQAKSCADGLFQEVLGRKDKADSTRNALSVLQRFKFLFYLPLNIDRNIKRGDYSLVINDYVRARSLFADTQVQVFRRVYSDVESRINTFRDMLQTKLLQLPTPLEEQKKLIRYLISLGCEGDPAWECLVNQQKWLIGILTKCKDDHIQEETTSLAEGESSIAKSPVAVAQGRGRDTNSSFKSTSDQTGWKSGTPQKILFVEELTNLMLDNIPDFWKLGQAYFSGSLFINTKETSDKHYKVDTSKHSQFKQMVTDLISLFSNLVRAAFLPESLENIAQETREGYGKWPAPCSDIPGGWLPSSVRHVRFCVNSLSFLDLPGDSPILIRDLALDIRTNCMFTLLKQAIADVKQLHTKEMWVVDTDDESGGTTQLPALFENIVNEAIQHLHEVVVQNKTGEPEIFALRTIQKDATALCTQLLQAFSPCLHKLAFDPPEITSKKFRGGKKVISPEETSSPAVDDRIPPLDKRLIIMLSNCNHTMVRVIPRLVENLNKHGYVEMEKAVRSDSEENTISSYIRTADLRQGYQAARDTYEDLDDSLFEAYVEEKSNPIVGAIEQNMYRGGFEWKTCKKPTGVRNYIKEMIMKMIEVHAEVFAVSPVFVTRVTQKVIEAVSEELTRLIQCVTEHGPYSPAQARLELLALQETVNVYLTPHASSCYKDALNELPVLKPEHKKLQEELLNKFKSQMKFQLMCFYGDSVLRTSSVA